MHPNAIQVQVKRRHTSPCSGFSHVRRQPTQSPVGAGGGGGRRITLGALVAAPLAAGGACHSRAGGRAHDRPQGPCEGALAA